MRQRDDAAHDRVVFVAEERMRAHDGQHVGRNVEQRGGHHQGGGRGETVGFASMQRGLAARTERSVGADRTHRRPAAGADEKPEAPSRDRGAHTAAPFDPAPELLGRRGAGERRQREHEQTVGDQRDPRNDVRLRRELHERDHRPQHEHFGHRPGPKRGECAQQPYFDREPRAGRAAARARTGKSRSVQAERGNS